VSLTLQVLLSGLAAGAVYGVVAIGHTIVFRLTGIVHFAFGDLIGVAVFASLAVAAGTGPVTQTSLGAGRFAAAIVVGTIVAAAAGAGTYRLVVEPFLARGSTIGWIAGVVAIGLAAQAFISSTFARPSYVYPDPFPFHDVGSSGVLHVGGSTIQVRSLFVIGVGCLLAVAAGWTLERTRFGRAVSAIAQDQEAARIVGVPVERLTTIAFGLVGAIAAVAAVLAAPSAPFDAQTGALLGAKGLAAALVIGFRSPLRAFVAGIVLGVLEAAAGSLEIDGASLGPQYREVLPLALLLLVVMAVSARKTAEEPE
jgi:branched-chain amino acid transport system permease protein